MATGDRFARERIERSGDARIYLIRQPESDPYKFEVCGTTGRLYTVRLCVPQPTCSCPDHAYRKNRCKHIYFVLTRCLRMSQEVAMRRQFDGATIETFLARWVQSRHAVVGAPPVPAAPTAPDNRKPFDGESCPICLDDMQEAANDTTWCRTQCGKSVHVACFGQWQKHRGSTCVYCRAPMDFAP